MEDNSRLAFIDFIKGLAVIFMMFQHLGIWFWDIPWDKITNILTDFPLYMAVNATGGFSAPAFIVCAGFGAFYFNEKFNSKLKFIKRGMVLLVFGYMMNFLVPSWFTPGSWYVLQLLGFCMIISPVLFVIKKKEFLFILTLFILILTIYIQYVLKTPSQYSSQRMGDYKMPGGVFRLIFAEGHFPVLPWTIFFITGMITADFYKKGQSRNILMTAIASLIISCTILAAGYVIKFSNPEIARFFNAGTSFYPLYPVMLFFLISLVLFSIYALSFIKFKPENVIVLTGRLSLTIFILHVVIFKQGLNLIGKYKYFNVQISFILMSLVVSIFILIAFLWSKKNFRFSFEWLLRKFS